MTSKLEQIRDSLDKYIKEELEKSPPDRDWEVWSFEDDLYEIVEALDQIINYDPTRIMIKKVLVTLLVTVDSEDEEICPSGDPLVENVVLNHIDDGFIDPVEEIYTSHISDYVEHSKRIQKRIEDLYHD